MISIITINFNNLNGLLETAESIAALCGDFEWVVVDGVSTDGSDEFIRNCDLIDKYIIEKDQGIADAWNKGISLASGPYFSLLNSGDRYESDAVQAITPYLSPDKIVCGRSRLFKAGVEKGVFHALPNKLDKGMYLPHHGAFLHKALFERVGPYKLLKYSMDYEWFLRARYLNVNFESADVCVGRYELGGLSDVSYKESFLTNRRIQIGYGASWLSSTLYCALAILKHWAKRRFL